jgi:hypothetical protein
MDKATTNRRLELAIRIVRGHARATTIDDIVALRFLIAEATEIMRAAEDALEAARPKRPTTVPTSERALSFQERRDAEKAVRKVAVRAALTIYDTVMIQGRRVGDLWYSELEALRSESAFAASLCDQLIRHAKPSTDTRVRDMVSQETLAAMVERAKAEAERVAAPLTTLPKNRTKSAASSSAERSVT